jgi:hypothetical protein
MIRYPTRPESKASGEEKVKETKLQNGKRGLHKWITMGYERQFTLLIDH